MRRPVSMLLFAHFVLLGPALAQQPPRSFTEKQGEKLPADPLDGPPFVNAAAWAIADGNTGEFLYGANADDALPMASTTKIMTAYLVMRVIAKDPDVLDQVVEVTRFAGNTGGSTARLRPGDKITVVDLLHGLLLPSGNDAANALAEHFGGRFPAPKDPRAVPWTLRSAGRSQAWINFVHEMNRTAKALKMRNTRYVNPHGLDAKQHQSSAKDILRLTKAAMAHEPFRKFVEKSTYRASIETASGSRRTETWKNTNRLLKIRGYRGVKTGTTTKAGACLVSHAVRGEHSLFVVVLNSNNRFGRYTDTRNLFRWAFTQRLAGGK